MFKLLPAVTVGLAALEMASAACTNPSVRQPWSALTDAEKASYIESTLCLMDPEKAPSKTGFAGAKSIWEDLQVAHVAQVQFIHRVGAFLPWHRWYMTVHETLLRDECGFTGPYPYWDEQADEAAGPLGEASIFSPSATTGFGSNLTDANMCVVDGAFTDMKLTLKIDLSRAEPVCLQRNFKQVQFDLISQSSVDACMAIEDYDNFNNCLGGTPHVSGHYAIGGTMDDVSLSPADPLFFMHHTNLDRLWFEWQSQNASRLTAIGGPNVASGVTLAQAQPPSLPVEAFLPYFNDGGDETTHDHIMWMAGVVPNITVSDAIDPKSDGICIDF
ncbi:hypothetical protein BGZ61DRAFT_428065 [Ilyonectria robusta]|uniref:uncharacterized protein n=1 Tax=Ilyonectria robusta TaxID=1079257 RepID=UPI001E8DD7E4|nr:uncharacterized protein BGZ61DRAFT_428065 [Ilyonectria robusta]KAH8672235.1 hypothetical protein BGZ61DRAFT_428065 [Ilyonectria robusta]